MKTVVTNIIPVHRFLANDLAFDIAVLSEYEVPKKGERHKPHRHTYYEIFVFTKGGGKHMIDFVDYPIVENSLHFISPGMVHIIQRNQACAGYVITFPEEFFSLVNRQDLLDQISLYTHYQQTPIVKCTEEKMFDIKYIVNQMISVYNGAELMKDELIRAYLSVLLIEAERVHTRMEVISDQKRVVNDKVHQFRKLIDEHFIEIRSVGEYAEKLNLTTKALTLFIKKHTGLTPGEHINHRVVIEAKRLLLNTDLSVKEIAFALNFDDPAYFGRFFKKEEKITPYQFRKQMSQKYQN